MSETATPAKKSSETTSSITQLGARIPTVLHKRLGHYAVEMARSSNLIVAEALEEYLKARGA